MDRLDFRSDTVTLPTPAMRKVMAAAEVGDDVYGEDPSVARLEAYTAELLGKESALYFPTGTMANQAALHALTRPGEVLLAATDCHVLRYEGGAAAAFAGLQIEGLGKNGAFTAADVAGRLPPDDAHFAPVSTVAVENTHNDAGGRVFPRADLEELATLARESGLQLHLDGARIWNATAATGISEADWASPFDTVSCCLSKGLGAPAGSLVCSSHELRGPLHRARKRLGGAMRQVGILAAAGLHALENHRARLPDDHENACRLAAGLRELGCRTEGDPETNIIMFHPTNAPRFWKGAWERGVRFGPPSGTRLRAVTHLGVTREDVTEALERLGKLEME
jgi:threonine aldolase